MYLIGIAGPSGAGKTELARALCRALDAPLISLDSYYRDLAHIDFEARAHHNFDDPASLDHELLREHLARLSSGLETAVPVYDFTRHLRSAAVERIPPARFGVIEGLWTLYWEEVRDLLGTRVYVDAADEVCFARRLDRDVRERGRTPESVMVQYAATVRPMAALYIQPARRYADVEVSGTAPISESVRAVLTCIEDPQARIARD